MLIVGVVGLQIVLVCSVRRPFVTFQLVLEFLKHGKI
jgi:hypothetical protein